MKFKSFWAQLPDKEAKEAFAKQVGTTPIYLSQIATKFRSPSPALAQRIAVETGGQVTLAELRPDVYGTAPAQRTAAA